MAFALHPPAIASPGHRGGSMAFALHPPFLTDTIEGVLTLKGLFLLTRSEGNPDKGLSDAYHRAPSRAPLLTGQEGRRDLFAPLRGG
jgi:hypothetical protein